MCPALKKSEEAAKEIEEKARQVEEEAKELARKKAEAEEERRQAEERMMEEQRTKEQMVSSSGACFVADLLYLLVTSDVFAYTKVGCHNFTLRVQQCY